MAGKKNVAAYSRKNILLPGFTSGKNVANYKLQRGSGYNKQKKNSVVSLVDSSSELSSLEESDDDRNDNDDDEETAEEDNYVSRRHSSGATTSEEEHSPKTRKLKQRQQQHKGQPFKKNFSMNMIPSNLRGDSEDSDSSSDSSHTHSHSETEDDSDEDQDDSDSPHVTNNIINNKNKTKDSKNKSKKILAPLPVPKRLDLSQIRGRSSKRPPASEVSTPSVTDDEKPQLIANNTSRKRPRRQSVVDASYDDKANEFPRNVIRKDDRRGSVIGRPDISTTRKVSGCEPFNDQSLEAALDLDDSSLGEEEDEVEAEEERAIVNELNQRDHHNSSGGDLFMESPNYSNALAGDEIDEDQYYGHSRGDDYYDNSPESHLHYDQDELAPNGCLEEDGDDDNDDDEDEDEDDDFYNISDVSFHDDFFEPIQTSSRSRSVSNCNSGRDETGDGKTEEDEEDEYLWSCFFTSDDDDNEQEVFYSDGQGRFYSDTETNYNSSFQYYPADSGEETDEDVNMPPPSHRKAGSRATEVLAYSNAGSRPPVLGSWDLSKTQQPFGIIDGLTTRNINGQQPQAVQNNRRNAANAGGATTNNDRHSRKRTFQSDDELSELALDEFIHTDELDDGPDGATNGDIELASSWYARKNVPMSAFRNRGLEQPMSMYYYGGHGGGQPGHSVPVTSASAAAAASARRDSTSLGMGLGGNPNRNRLANKEVVITPVRSVRHKMKKRLSKRAKKQEDNKSKAQQSPRLNPTDLIDELVDMGALSPLFRGIY